MLKGKLIASQDITVAHIENSVHAMARLADRLQKLADLWEGADDDYKSSIAHAAWDDIKSTSHIWTSFIDNAQIRMNQLKELCREEDS